VERWGSRLGALLALIGGIMGLAILRRRSHEAIGCGGEAFPIRIGLLPFPLAWIRVTLYRLRKERAHSFFGMQRCDFCVIYLKAAKFRWEIMGIL
jgi:SNF family Na+-dependent transporter